MEYFYAMFFGGLLCVIAQILIDKTAFTPAKILTGYVVGGVVLTGVGLYDKFVSLAGCGATVPLTGFGYCLADGVRKAVDEHGLIGALIGGLNATSGGIAAAILFSLLAAIFFTGKPENL